MDFSLSLRGEKSVNHGIRIYIESTHFVHFGIFQGHNSAKNKAGAESSQQKLGGHCIAFRLSPQLFQCFS